MDYLKNDQYYADPYDLLTIKDCLSWENHFLNTDLSTYKEAKDFVPDKATRFKRTMADFTLYFVKGDRYKDKQTKINEWTNRDRILDEKAKNTPDPPAPTCEKCRTIMVPESKNIESILDNPVRVLFFFKCNNCGKRELVYENGQIYVSKLDICPKCNSKLAIKFTRKKNVLVTKRDCKSCSFKDKDVDNFGARNREWNKKEKADAELLAKYRSAFCLTKDEGDKYVEGMGRLTTVMKSLEESQKKQADPNYQKAMKLKKLTVAELEKLIIPALEKQNYIKFSFDKPEMSKYIALPFSVQESDTNQKEYDSVHKLQKLLKATLEDTNWRLMSEGISYRLGILQGRLRAYESEEDLLTLVRPKKASPSTP